jgi:hypothetical protein
VAYGLEGLPNSDIVHLMTFIIWLTDDQPAEFTITTRSESTWGQLNPDYS